MDDFWKGINLSPVHSSAAAATYLPSFPSGAGFSHVPGLHEFLPLPPEIGGSTSSPPAAVVSSVSLGSQPAPPPPPRLARKRKPVSHDGSDPERRHQRLIKNRESADRSRAKKIAYTADLEIKIQYLTQENKKLKMQRVKLLAVGIPSAPIVPPEPEKDRKLCRSLTF
ncbi:unnamed protein product [Cuscuta campestris]|uniref:BZIP domain-containing protein n=1 Tax=Cuscuta campestris TaxID=132261 RepID=A0A484L0I1_9ASTE|nr:unnamed protein product [Cuscuta campestris]